MLGGRAAREAGEPAVGDSDSEDQKGGYALVATLWRNEPWLDITCGVTKAADPWPEADWLALPLKVNAPKFLLGRTGSLVDPAKDIVRGASHVTFCTNTGVAVTGTDGAGVGICPAGFAHHQP